MALSKRYQWAIILHPSLSLMYMVMLILCCTTLQSGPEAATSVFLLYGVIREVIVSLTFVSQFAGMFTLENPHYAQQVT